MEFESPFIKIQSPYQYPSSRLTSSLFQYINLETPLTELAPPLTKLEPPIIKITPLLTNNKPPFINYRPQLT